MAEDLEQILMNLDDSKFCKGCVVGGTSNCGSCGFGFDLEAMEVWRTGYNINEDYTNGDV